MSRMNRLGLALLLVDGFGTVCSRRGGGGGGATGFWLADGLRGWPDKVDEELMADPGRLGNSLV